MVHVIATLAAKPEMKADLIDAAKQCVASTRQEDGCISYELFQSMLDPNKLVFVEEWESAEYLPAHSKAEHMKSFGRVAAKCVAAPAQIQIITAAKVEKR